MELVTRTKDANRTQTRQLEEKMGADNDGRGCSGPEVGERPAVQDSRRSKVMSKRLRCRV